LHATAGRLQALASELGLTPVDVDETWPTGAATATIHSNTTTATSTLQRRVQSTSSRLHTSAEDYRSRDEQSSLGLKAVDFKTGGGAEPGAVTPSVKTDQANRGKLAAAEADIQRQMQVLEKQYDRLAVDAYVHGPPVSADTSKQLSSLKNQIDAAKGRLNEYHAVDKALSNASDTYLMQFNNSGSQVWAAVAVGNPDTATNVAVMVPGMTDTVQKTLPVLVSEAADLNAMSTRQLVLAGRDPSVSTIAWIGYDVPPSPISGDLSVLSDAGARAGAHNLAPFLQGLHDADPDAHVTLIGHSYGSLVTGIALEDLKAEGLHPVSDALFVGSPGLDATSATQFGLSPDHVFGMNTPNDVVSNLAAPLAPLHGWGTDPNDLLPLLSTQAGVAPDGVSYSSSNGHGQYFMNDTMSQWNIGAVIADIPYDEVAATPAEYPLFFPPEPR
jgi:hypothetical protein